MYRGVFENLSKEAQKDEQLKPTVMALLKNHDGFDTADQFKRTWGFGDETLLWSIRVEKKEGFAGDFSKSRRIYV